MDALIAQAGDKILSLGVIGAIFIILGAVIVVLYRQNQALHLARVADAKEMAKIVEQNSVETKLSAEVQRQVTGALQQSNGNWQAVITEIRNTLAEFLRERRRGGS